MGTTHALSAGVAWNALALGAPAVIAAVGAPGGLEVAAGTVVAVGAVLCLDLDHRQSTAARSAPFVTRVVSWVIRKATGGHRKAGGLLPGTHTFEMAALVTAATWLLVDAGHSWWPAVILGGLALDILRPGTSGVDAVARYGGAFVAVAALDSVFGLAWGFLPVAVAVGWVIGIVGDAGTKQGVRPLWLFPSFHWRWARLRTGGARETGVQAVLVVAAVCMLLAHAGLWGGILTGLQVGASATWAEWTSAAG